MHGARLSGCFSRFVLSVLLGVGCLLGRLPGLEAASPARSWTTAYYAGWTQGDMPPSTIDFTPLTHVIHFSLLPKSDGTLDSASFDLTPTASSTLLSRAHANGTKVLVCVGGAGTQVQFQGATKPAAIDGFVTRLVSFVTSRGYDGLDIDWEPLDPGDGPAYKDLVSRLSSQFAARNPRPLLTAAVATEPALLYSLQGSFDQINVMTYDLAGPWEGWVTWFNAPLFDGGYRFPSTGGLITSGDGLINRFLAAGVQASKLGIGIAFYGAVWSGGTGLSTGGASLPRQEWQTAPTVTAMDYRNILATYYRPERYHWDTNAQSAYLSIDNPGSSADKFISYDDEHASQAKVAYAHNRGLGGVMIWELAGGYLPSKPAGQRHPLLTAIRTANEPARFQSIEVRTNVVHLAFESVPLARYRLEASASLGSPSWLLVTNVVGTGGRLEVLDRLGSGSGARYYRIQWPP